MNQTERTYLEAARDDLARSIKGPHAAHHANVLMNAAWLQHRNVVAAAADLNSKAARYAA